MERNRKASTSIRVEIPQASGIKALSNASSKMRRTIISRRQCHVPASRWTGTLKSTGGPGASQAQQREISHIALLNQFRLSFLPSTISKSCCTRASSRFMRRGVRHDASSIFQQWSTPRLLHVQAPKLRVIASPVGYNWWSIYPISTRNSCGTTAGFTNWCTIIAADTGFKGA